MRWKGSRPFASTATPPCLPDADHAGRLDGIEAESSSLDHGITVARSDLPALQRGEPMLRTFDHPDTMTGFIGLVGLGAIVGGHVM